MRDLTDLQQELVAYIETLKVMALFKESAYQRYLAHLGSLGYAQSDDMLQLFEDVWQEKVVRIRITPELRRFIGQKGRSIWVNSDDRDFVILDNIPIHLYLGVSKDQAHEAMGKGLDIGMMPGGIRLHGNREVVLYNSGYGKTILAIASSRLDPLQMSPDYFTQEVLYRASISKEAISIVLS